MRNWLKFLIYITFIVGLFIVGYRLIQGSGQIFTVSGVKKFTIAGFTLITTLSAIFVAVVVFFENRNPTQTIAWLLVLSVSPIFGFFFYLMFGMGYQKIKEKKTKNAKDMEVYDELVSSFDEWYAPEELVDIEKQKLYRLAKNITRSPISYTTETKVLTNGEMTFKSIKEELLKAKESIFLEYYIIRNDNLGNEIKDILIQKARDGVKIKVIIDAVGCLKLGKEYIKELEMNNVEVAIYSPVLIPILNDKVNFRNHRKIIVIDNEIGFTGGINIGDEYLGKVDKYGMWRDTHMYLKGEAVRILQLIFINDWYMVKKEMLPLELDKRPTLNQVEPEVHGGVQIISDGPDTEWQNIKKLIFTMITSAQKSIYIQTPYLIPDQDILSALKISALSGVDVKIITPGIKDKFIVYQASRSYFEELIQSGVEIYEYTLGFMHSKILIVDGDVATIGTANMDMRSYHLNFEINVYLYGTESVKELTRDFMNDLEVCNQIEREEFKKRGIKNRFYESLCRLSSPLL